MRTMHPDFLAFLRLLKEHGIRYLIVGGYAVAFHGYPRMTMDLDIWVEASRENAGRLVAAIKEFGFETPQLQAEIFTSQGKIIRMGAKPQLIEILTSVSGITFADCYLRRVSVEIDETPIDVIHLDDLKRNKLAAARPRDMADLEYLP